MSQFTLAQIATSAGVIALVTGIVQILKLNTGYVSGSLRIRLIVWALCFVFLFAAKLVSYGQMDARLAALCLAESAVAALGCFGMYNIALEKIDEELKAQQAAIRRDETKDE